MNRAERRAAARATAKDTESLTFLLAPAAVNRLREYWFRFQGAQAMFEAAGRQMDAMATEYNQALYAVREAVGLSADTETTLDFATGLLHVVRSHNGIKAMPLPQEAEDVEG